MVLRYVLRYVLAWLCSRRRSGASAAQGREGPSPSAAKVLISQLASWASSRRRAPFLTSSHRGPVQAAASPKSSCSVHFVNTRQPSRPPLVSPDGP
eukprot:4732724-Prymnesium_polylepis.1